MRHFDQAERRRRLMVRHHLAAPALTVEQVAGDLVGLHSSDPATVVLSARARLDPFAVADLEHALYERRTLLRMLAMRRTMFVVPLDLAAVLDASCTKALVAGERRKLVQLLETAGVTADTDAWIERVRAETLAILRANEPLPASRLTKLLPELALQFRVAAGKRYEATIGVSTRMLFLLSAAGEIVRTRPLGSWLSSQYRWTTTEQWLGGLPALAPAAARAELVRRWLATYGPGTMEDISWWTKWSKAQVRDALNALDVVVVSVDTGDDDKVAGVALADDLEDTPVEVAVPGGREPVSLLPSLDPSVMGWKQRAWYLGPHAGQLFDRNGNAGPTVWVGGRAVGAWGQRGDGQVVTQLLEPVDAEPTERIAAAAARLTAWMDGIRVTPRFTSALERELARG